MLSESLDGLVNARGGEGGMVLLTVGALGCRMRAEATETSTNLALVVGCEVGFGAKATGWGPGLARGSVVSVPPAAPALDNGSLLWDEDSGLVRAAINED